MSIKQRSRAHETLRITTEAAHRALEDHPLMQRLTGSDLTRELYAESLAAMYRPHLQLERQVHESRHHFESGLTLSARLKLLESDLVELDWPVSTVSYIPPDRLEERVVWLGQVYVLEGSRLGGAFIAKSIQSSLGETLPSRFFGEPMTPGSYDAILAMLEQELKDQDDIDQAVAGARGAFAAYKAELDAFDYESVTLKGGRVQ